MSYFDPLLFFQSVVCVHPQRVVFSDSVESLLHSASPKDTEIKVLIGMTFPKLDQPDFWEKKIRVGHFVGGGHLN